MKAWLIVATLVVAACSGASDEGVPEPSHHVSPMHAAIDQFVKDGRTPRAFTQLTSSFEEMRGTDPVLAGDAELRLLALAAPMIEEARSRPLAVQLDELALTVWPTLLSDPLTGAGGPTVVPRDGESPQAYVARLCAGELACGSESIDAQVLAVRALALRNANERMRVALARCLHCESDGPTWQRLGWTLESLDREAAHDHSRAMRSQRPVVGYRAW